MTVVETVVFDVGETLVDESRMWAELADRAGVTSLTLFGVLGALIERGEDHRRVWALLGIPPPSTDGIGIRAGDLYPDVVGCFEELRGAGCRIGIAGNQPSGAEDALRGLELPIDFAGSSAAWGVEKPSRRFFARLSEVAGSPPERIAYVGDRVDNDVLPAKEAGMVAVFIRRGPWGALHARLPSVYRADVRVESLAEVPATLARR